MKPVMGGNVSVLLTDQDIARLLAESKCLPVDWKRQLELKPKSGHKEQQIDIAGVDGSLFRLILRQADANPLNFSAILAYSLPGTNQVVRLCRCNGKSHEHTNVIEGDRFYGYHVHLATQRYQELGGDEDGHAEPCEEYTDLQGAVAVLCDRCGITVPQDPQMSLLEEETWQ